MSSKQEKGHQEINKKNLLQVLHENFKLAERVTYIHRLIYIGEHTFSSSTDKGLNEVFEKIIKSINDHYCDEKLTGFLLYYNRYFCHVIEGSEESLIKHLKMIIQNESVGNKLGRLKLLIAYHHINQRFLDEWLAVTGQPPTLLGQISTSGNIKDTMDKIKYCIDKLYGLGLSLRPEDIEEEENQSSKSDDGTIGSFNVFGHEMSSIAQFLPEISILEFLLESTHTQDLRKYLALYGEISYLDSYEDLVWPVPCDFIPMDVFDKEHNPVTDLTITQL